MRIQKSLSRIINHRFLSLILCWYPILYLYNINFGRMSFSLVLRSLIVSSIVFISIFLVISRLTRKPARSLQIVTLSIIGFFSYGHAYNALIASESLNSLGHHRYLVPIYGVIFLVGLMLALWRANSPERFIPFLNIFSLYLIISVIFSLSLKIYKDYRRSLQTNDQAAVAYDIRSYSSELVLPDNPPDIYLIILDAYANQVAIKEGFGYDNTPFIESLEEIGFYVPCASQSNYSMTTLSVPSMMQMAYLEEFGEELIQESNNWRDFSPYIHHNNVRSTLEGLGYQTIAFDTGGAWTNIEDASIFFKLPENYFAPIVDFEQLNSFERLLINTTVFRAVRALAPADASQYDAQVVPAYPKYLYESLHYALDRLPEIPTTIQGPNFVYVHFFATHLPYVVDENGDFHPSRDAENYIPALKFINGELIDVISRLIADSPTPPIILLQADHGFSYIDRHHRMETFSAYYLPDQGSQAFYDSITPVNLFPLIFNHYFGGQFPLKEDRSLYSSYDDPYEWIEMPNDLSNCQRK